MGKYIGFFKNKERLNYQSANPITLQLFRQSLIIASKPITHLWLPLRVGRHKVPGIELLCKGTSDRIVEARLNLSDGAEMKWRQGEEEEDEEVDMLGYI